MKALIHLWRLLKAGMTLASFNLLMPPEILGERAGPLRLLARLSAGSQAKAPLEKRISAALVKLGPSYVKLGQLLATRPDFVGPKLARSLSDLHDEVPPFDMATARLRVEESLNQPLETAFARFDPPVAAASLAQVHSAYLPPKPAAENEPVAENEPTAEDEPEALPRKVAVKVMRPGIARAFARDIETFAWTARWVERLKPSLKRLEPVKLVETLARSAALELDLRLEAAAADELAEYMANRDDFIIPKIDWNRTAKGVMTIEWIDGIKVTNIEALRDQGFDLSYLGDRVIKLFLIQALDYGFFHADMHPGNLFVLPADDQEDKPHGEKLGKIAAVDYGIMGRLDRDTRRFMAEILFGFITQDYRRVAIAHFDAGYVPPHHSIEEFAQALRAIGAPLIGQGADKISMARVLAQLFETTRNFDMHLQPQLVLLQKTMVVVEGVARLLDPRVNMWESAQPIVEGWMERTLGFEGRLTEAAEGAQTLSRVAGRLPQIVEGLERMAQLSVTPQSDGSFVLAPPPAPGQPAPAVKPNAKQSGGKASSNNRLIVLVAAVGIAAWIANLTG